VHQFGELIGLQLMEEGEREVAWTDEIKRIW